ncbi:hypothetical protein AYI69_g10813 [Smittium culicis]|uniref:Uncharacterized protein n=1 Tax=Smittium culicis TaxID=133412 RepID=A0A1R1X3B2_9FUNG|nr:hypothetical protein AYI69_g10813 [Smittium culicis]
MLEPIFSSLPVTSLEIIPKAEHLLLIKAVNYKDSSIDSRLAEINLIEEQSVNLNADKASIERNDDFNRIENRILLAGSGSELQIFDRFNNSNLVATFKILGDQRIHGLSLG